MITIQEQYKEGTSGVIVPREYAQYGYTIERIRFYGDFLEMDLVN